MSCPLALPCLAVYKETRLKSETAKEEKVTDGAHSVGLLSSYIISRDIPLRLLMASFLLLAARLALLATTGMVCQVAPSKLLRNRCCTDDSLSSGLMDLWLCSEPCTALRLRGSLSPLERFFLLPTSRRCRLTRGRKSPAPGLAVFSGPAAASMYLDEAAAVRRAAWAGVWWLVVMAPIECDAATCHFSRSSIPLCPLSVQPLLTEAPLLVGSCPFAPAAGGRAAWSNRRIVRLLGVAFASNRRRRRE